jgi:hypothetical protein
MGESIGEPMRQKLASFARTVRDSGFKVGLAETRDALAILAGPPGARATSSSRPCARSLRHSFGLGAVRRNFRCVLARPRHAPGDD